MDTRLANRVYYFEESQTLEMAKKARELSAKGIKVINLSLGEPDFATPKHIIDAAKKAMDDGFTKYTPVAGFADLRQAISDKFLHDNGLNYSVNQIASFISDNTINIPERLGEARETLANIKKVKEVFGWEPNITLDQWFKERNI